eukprot:gene4992-4888_t
MKLSTLTFGSFRGDLRCGLELPALKQGTVVEEKAPAARTKLPLAPKPRPLMARVNVPNSVFALGSMPILQRR